MPEQRNSQSPYTLTEAEYQQIADLAAEGVREVDIAYRLNISQETWAKIKKRDPQALQAFNKGRGELHDKLCSKLIQNALNGDRVSVIFALKSMFGYVEGVDPQAADQGRVNIVFNLPSSVTPEQYEQLVRMAPKELAHERAPDRD